MSRRIAILLVTFSFSAGVYVQALTNTEVVSYRVAFMMGYRVFVDFVLNPSNAAAIQVTKTSYLGIAKSNVGRTKPEDLAAAIPLADLLDRSVRLAKTPDDAKRAYETYQRLSEEEIQDPREVDLASTVARKAYLAGLQLAFGGLSDLVLDRVVKADLVLDYLKVQIENEKFAPARFAYTIFWRRLADYQSKHESLIRQARGTKDMGQLFQAFGISELQKANFEFKTNKAFSDINHNLIYAFLFESELHLIDLSLNSVDKGTWSKILDLHKQIKAKYIEKVQEGGNFSSEMLSIQQQMRSFSDRLELALNHPGLVESQLKSLSESQESVLRSIDQLGVAFGKATVDGPSFQDLEKSLAELSQSQSEAASGLKAALSKAAENNHKLNETLNRLSCGLVFAN